MTELNILIIESYPKDSRKQFEDVDMRLACILYADMLIQHQPYAEVEIVFSADPGINFPYKKLDQYDGVIWPGSNFTIYDEDNPLVIEMIKFCQSVFEAGVPQFGSCWGIQMAAVAAGGEVKKNPKGREMGIARKIHLSKEGMEHPMYQGKPVVFNGFTSHDDEVIELPPGGIHLAANDFTKVQGIEVSHKNGVFWATQYHTEYNLYEMTRLMHAREEQLIELGFFNGNNDFEIYVKNLEILFFEQKRKDLRWQLNIDDDILKDSIRQIEFINWLNKLVIPNSKDRRS